MSNLKYVIAVLALLLVFLGFVIIEPAIERNRELKAAATDARAGEDIGGDEGNLEEAATPLMVYADSAKAVEFDLKYDKYLVPAPYQYDVNGESRAFEFEKMIETLEKAEEEETKGKLTYIDNYKNRNGMAPLYHGKSTDLLGNRRSASAPGYHDPSNLEEFDYIFDGTLVRVLEETYDFIKVSSVENGNEYYVPSKYVQTEDPVTSLNKAIVVDRKNQNIAAFEKRVLSGNVAHPERTGWVVVSYSMATTGKVGKYHQPTPLGYYFAIEKRERFYYLKDGTNQIEGYAPYAVRFSAGAYVHGVGVPYKYTEDGARIDPGFQEFSNTIGTIPLSHKCVRNYTSHAKFLYDWYVRGETIVAVIE